MNMWTRDAGSVVTRKRGSAGVLAAVCLLLSASASLANTFTVTNTANSGAGSLRQAIINANGHVGADVISFNISGTGLHTITPQTGLPIISDTVTIDGYTQPGSAPHTSAAAD